MFVLTRVICKQKKKKEGNDEEDRKETKKKEKKNNNAIGLQGITITDRTTCCGNIAL